MTKEDFRRVVGQNIKAERTARGMSIDELAELVSLSSGFIGLIERGERGLTLYNIWRICLILDLNINDLLFTSQAKGLNRNTLNQKRKKIHALSSMFGETELDFIISFLKELKKIIVNSKQA